MHKLLIRLKNGADFPRLSRRWLLLLGLLAAGAPAASSAPALAAADSHRPQPLPPDRNALLPARRPDPARLRELAGQREFRYATPEATNDAWDALRRRFWRWLGGLISTPTARFTGKYGLYTVVLAMLVFAVLKLLQVDITGVFGRTPRRGPLTYDTVPENIHAVDFPARIAAAEEAGNFRLATRLGYLEVLKQLTDRGLTHWQPDKTNHAYLAELAGGPLREAFRSATREFEYVWYGELRLNSALYQQARASQRAVSRQLAGATTAVGFSSPNPLPA